LRAGFLALAADRVATSAAFSFASGVAAIAGSPRARASRSWKQSRTPWVKASGSGISSRQAVGETTMRAS
jgi:hypothetical protein